MVSGGWSYKFIEYRKDVYYSKIIIVNVKEKDKDIKENWEMVMDIEDKDDLLLVFLN